MPSYDIGTAAFAVGATRKWVDNITSHFSLPGVDSTGRGVQRDFSFDAVILLAVVRSLVDHFAMPAARAIEIADQVRLSDDGVISLADGLRLIVDHQFVAHEVRRRLLDAAESVPRVPRGRPPRSRSRQAAS